jgi:hypothetical protein
MTLEQRCWNHDTREAVCRCPDCGRSYCRECVSEHESRLLCAACLRTKARAVEPRRRSRLAPLGMALAGVLLAWVVFFGAGEGILLVITRLEQASWQSR